MWLYVTVKEADFIKRQQKKSRPFLIVELATLSFCRFFEVFRAAAESFPVWVVASRKLDVEAHRGRNRNPPAFRLALPETSVALAAPCENQIKHCHASRAFFERKRECACVYVCAREGNLGDDNPVNSIADNFLCVVYLINASAVFALPARVLK